MTVNPKTMPAEAFSTQPSSLWGLLIQELSPRPGRLADALRITALTLAVIVISETFHVPLTAYSAYIVFFASKEEKASTVLTGVVITIAVTIAVLSAIGIYTVSAGEPGLRLPLMALIAFGGMFMSRVSPLGPASFVIGFIITVSLSLIDIMPPIALLPTEEILTQTVLWLWVVVMLPVGLVVAVNLVAGNDPAEMFRQGLERRLAASGHMLIRDGATQAADAATGNDAMSVLLRYLKLAVLLKRIPAKEVPHCQALAARALEISALAGEWRAFESTDSRCQDIADECGRTLLEISQYRANGSSSLDLSLLSRIGEQLDELEPKAALLLRCMIDLILHFAVLMVSPADEVPIQPTASQARKMLFVPDAFSNPAHLRYALKATLCIMTAYVTYNLLAWPEIRTCMITCFFVSLGSVGETMHKMTLRLTGALIGGGLGLGTVIFVMPHLESITDLCLVVGAVTFCAAWIGTSSEKLSYAGYQMAMAYFMCVLIGYGPTIELSVARDRVVGILLGNLIVFFVSTAIWPVSIKGQAWVALGVTLRKLADICHLQASGEDKSKPTRNDAAYFAFDTSLSESLRLQSFDWFDRTALGRDVNSQSAEMEFYRWLQSLLPPLLILNPSLGASKAMGQPEDGKRYFESVGRWLSSLGEGLASSGNPEAEETPAERLPSAQGTNEPLGLRQWRSELEKRAQALGNAYDVMTSERNKP